MELDKIDKQILQLLQNDSQITVKDIAMRTGLSTTPVFARIKQLEKKGIIKKYVALVDRGKLDRGLTIFCIIVLNDGSKSTYKKFETDIAKIEEVIECYKIAGNIDYLLKIVAKNIQEYNDIINLKIVSLDTVRNTVTNFVMAEFKNTTVIPIK